MLLTRSLSSPSRGQCPSLATSTASIMGNTKYKKLYTLSGGSSTTTAAPSTPDDALTLATLTPPSHIPVLDTHCHILTTFSSYRSKYPNGQHQTLAQFIKALYGSSWASAAEGMAKVEGVVDVWCEAPVLYRQWEDVIGGVDQGDWGNVKYNFVMGVHPHDAKKYTPHVELQITEASSHPSNVGIGEIGLDYHYDSSPRPIQQTVFQSQLQLAVRLNKSITIHSREANEDCYNILTRTVPKHWKIHVHCFTDSLEFAKQLMDFYPNLYIGITGVATFTSNPNTRSIIKYLASHFPNDPLRILLETDSPFMVPSNLPTSQVGVKGGKKLPLSTSSMIPWVAEYVSKVANEAIQTTSSTKRWTVDQVMMEARENAKIVYGI